MDNDKLSLAAALIEQSPPGQVNDVLRGKSLTWMGLLRLNISVWFRSPDHIE